MYINITFLQWSFIKRHCHEIFCLHFFFSYEFNLIVMNGLNHYWHWDRIYVFENIKQRKNNKIYGTPVTLFPMAKICVNYIWENSDINPLLAGIIVYFCCKIRFYGCTNMSEVQVRVWRIQHNFWLLSPT